MTQVLIAGVSTRAAAESAAGAGLDVTSIDAFGDIDQHPSVRVTSLGHGFTPRAAATAARPLECDAVVYLANFENHPRAIEALAEGRALWGNTPDAVRRVRDPLAVADTLRRRGFAVPDVTLQETRIADAVLPAAAWLAKPVASGGGQRIRPWQPHQAVPHGCYLQQFIDGVPGSVAFVAAGGRTVPIGISRQIIGDGAFGGDGYQYCGSILGAQGDSQFAQDDRLAETAGLLASAVVDAFGLVGLNGIDFIARGGVPYAIEVNPRWSSSMELVERTYHLSVLGMHAAACTTGILPDFDLAQVRRRPGASGKAIVFARRNVKIGDTSSWRTNDDSVRDIPHAGDLIPAGAPICTVFAIGRDAAACYDSLVEAAANVYTQLE